MRLSVCMIVRNEETRLETAVESVRAVADEIVVLDTGSTDGTVALAERLGAKVRHFTWCDDFAAARNACASHARGEWILWLDADERLKAGTEEGLKRDLRDASVVAYQMVREDFFSRERENWSSEMYQLRLVRRDLPCRFVGRIHEHLVPWPVDYAVRIGKTVRVSAGRLQHWGYTNDRLPEKFARAAALCELELKERPGQLYYLVELMRAHFSIGATENLSKAAAALAEAVKIMMSHASEAEPPTPLCASLIEQLLAMPGQTLAGEAELVALAQRWFPRNPPLAWAIARRHFVIGEWAEAERELRRTIEMIRTRTYDRYGSFDPRIEEDALFNLGVCLVRQARLKDAAEVFASLSASGRRGEEAKANLRAVAELRAKFGV